MISKADANSDPIISMTLVSDTRSFTGCERLCRKCNWSKFANYFGCECCSDMGSKALCDDRIRLLPDKLAAYDLTPLDVKLALDRENVESAFRQN